jgi:hypothetical protein
MSLPADAEGQLVVATIAFPSFLGAVPVFDATVGSATFATTAYPVLFK